MNTDDFILIVEINESNYIFVAGFLNEDNNFQISEKTIVSSYGFSKNKFTNLDLVKQTVKKNIEIIENKLNCIFKEVTIIIDNFYCLPVNVSGYKRLNGSQILKENISFILNSTKLSITENEKDKTILHIFNSKSILDGAIIENLPIGLFGDFYNHELSFFLIKNNDLKNIKQIFYESNINIKKILIKSFVEGTQLIENNKKEDTFFILKINKNSSQINYFEKSSLRYIENFFFGSNFIYKDVEKVCSLGNEIVKKFFLTELSKNINDVNNNEFLEKEYFADTNYRKITKELIFDVANSRIEEILNIMFIKNTNIKFLNKSSIQLIIIIEDRLIQNIFKNYFKTSLIKTTNLKLEFIDRLNSDTSMIMATTLSNYGWKKEAIPITQTKNSIISKIFKYLFN